MSLPACVDAYIDGEADDAQLDELAAWLRADPEHPHAFMRAMRLHHALREGHLGAVAPVGSAAAAMPPPALRLLPRHNRQRRQPRTAWTLAVVAAACLVLGVFGFLVSSYRSGAPEMHAPTVIAEITASAGDALIWRSTGARKKEMDIASYFRPRADDDWRATRASHPAHADAHLRSGDVVENRGDAVVVVSFTGEATRFSLRPHATVEFHDVRPGKWVVLHAGAFDAIAAKQPPGRPLTCIGRWATATVVGTTFTVIDTASATRLEVSEGRVRFTPTVRPTTEPIEIEVGAGEFAMAGPTGDDLIRPRPKAQPIGPILVGPATPLPAVAPTIWGSYMSRWKHGLPADPTFFPIAVWQQNPMHAQAYGAIGVNVYVGLWGGPTEEQLSELDAARMRVICSQNQVGLAHRDDPMIVGWMYDATPDNAQDPAAGAAKGEFGSSIEPSAVADVCRAMVAADPTRPIHMTFGPGTAYTAWTGRGHSTGMTEMYPRYIRAADYLSFAIYPLNAVMDDLREARGNLWYVPLGIDHLQAWTREADPQTPKPAWAMIECTRIFAAGESPSFAQVRSEVWMSLIHGASGICWFCHTFGPGREDAAAALRDPAVKATIETLDREILSLAPALNAPTVTGYARVMGSDADVSIDAMAKRVGDETWIFTAAMRGKASEATIELPGPARVEVLGEQRVIDAPQGSFHDSFAPYGVHLYRIVSAARQAPAILSPTEPEGPVVPPRP